MHFIRREECVFSAPTGNDAQARYSSDLIGESRIALDWLELLQWTGLIDREAIEHIRRLPPPDDTVAAFEVLAAIESLLSPEGEEPRLPDVESYTRRAAGG